MWYFFIFVCAGSSVFSAFRACICADRAKSLESAVGGKFADSGDVVFGDQEILRLDLYTDLLLGIDGKCDFFVVSERGKQRYRICKRDEHICMSAGDGGLAGTSCFVPKYRE